MSTIIVILTSFIAIALSVIIYWSFKQHKVSQLWMIRYWAALVLGCNFGIYFGFFFSYFASRDFKIHGFPIPAAFLVLEQYEDGSEQWINLPTPFPVLFAGANIIVFACFCVSLSWCAHSALRSKAMKEK